MGAVESTEANYAGAGTAGSASLVMLPNSLQALGIAPLLTPQTLQASGWANVAGLPYFIEHPEIGLVQLVAQYTPPGAPAHTHFCVRKMNPLARRGESPYTGALYTVPAKAPHVVPLSVALVEFRPEGADAASIGRESGASMSTTNDGYVRLLTSGAIVYTVPWRDVQRVLTIDETGPPDEAERRLRALRSSAVKTLQDVVAIKRAVRLLERSHPIEVRAWTSVTLCDADAWGSDLAATPEQRPSIQQPASLGGDVARR